MAKAEVVKSRIWGLDVLKAIAICMVIPLHTGLFHPDFIHTPTISNFLQYMARLASEGVPLFFFVNGFLLLGPAAFDLKKHLYRIKKVLFLLLIWSILLVLSQVLIQQSSLTLSGVLRFVLGTRIGSQYTGVLWFLQALLGLYILFPFVKSVFDSNGQIRKIAIATVIVMAVGVALIGQVVPVFTTLLPSHWQDVLRELGSWFACLNPFANVGALLFFMVGGFVRRHVYDCGLSSNRWIVLGLIAYLFVLVWGVFASILSGKLLGVGMLSSALGGPLVTLGWFALAMGPFSKWGEVGFLRCAITSLGSATMGIYLLHIPVITALGRLWTPGSFGERFLFALGVLVISWVLTIIIKHIPGVRRLVAI